MKRKFVVLGAIAAFLALFAARIPSAHAVDPFSEDFTITYTACTAGSPCNADTNVDNGEPVGVKIDTGLQSTPDIDKGSFYDSVRTVYSGLQATGTVPAGQQVGTGSFMIHVNVGSPCSLAAGTINPSYPIYAAQDANNVGTYPSLGYAKGLTGAESWATFDAAGWIQDFDDDNNNNRPDNIDSPVPAGDTLAQTVQDINPANGIPDGADKEPLYLPLLDAIVGQTHDVRYFGDAVVAAGAVETPVDFVTYFNVPSAGQQTQYAVISEGGGLGLLPSNPSGSSTSTCTPFTSSLDFLARTSAGSTVATATGAGMWQIQGSVAPDYDNDGIPAYQDNCDAVSNAAQTDTDGDGIGDACDPAPAVAAAADADGDGFANWIDTCPTTKSIVDDDSDSVANACDPAPSVAGNGGGYAAGFSDHDFFATITGGALPQAQGPLPAAVETLFVDSNDNHVADSAESGSTPLGSGLLPGDSDGDGALDNVDADPLNPNDNGGGRLVKCAAQNDCGNDGINAQPSSFNMRGDGCNDTDEATLAGFGAGPFDQWMFYDVPVPALFSAPSPATTFRTSGILSAGMAQAVFGYFKKAAKLGSLEYNQDLNHNNVMDGVEYDRSVTADTFAHAADGVVGAADAQKAFAQFKAGYKCTTNPGGYKLNDSTIP